MPRRSVGEQPNVLFVMTDQQRFDTIAALGNSDIYTPNLDRLVARGTAFINGYSTSPLCAPARYTIRTGCEATTTNVVQNTGWAGMHHDIEHTCGAYLAATMSRLGYRTFGVGKFHTTPWDAPVGFDVQLHSEELYQRSPDQRARDSYVSFLAREHPEYAWIEGLMGERTEMYYVPQMRPLPAHLGVEAWAADQGVELISARDDRPWFGFVSFVGPHPPFAPPQPFNRIYDPDRMPAPIRSKLAVDHMDQYLPLMNHLMWADDISEGLAKVLKARYYGEISYIDQCLGRILDALDARPDADNTVICFFADHGDHLDDHHAWQKESFFEASARVPLLVSWPGRIPTGIRSDLVCLTDLFGLATSAAGQPELREGIDILGLLTSDGPGRDTLYGYLNRPGTLQFKLMVRRDNWKLIYLANGGQTQLFDVEADPHEIHELTNTHPNVVGTLLDAGAEQLPHVGYDAALENNNLLALPFKTWQEMLKEAPWIEMCPTGRLHQFDVSTGATTFPQDAAEVLRSGSAPVKSTSVI